MCLFKTREIRGLGKSIRMEIGSGLGPSVPVPGVGRRQVRADSQVNSSVTGFIYGGASFGSPTMWAVRVWYDAFPCRNRHFGGHLGVGPVGGWVFQGFRACGLPWMHQGNVYWSGDFVGSVNMGSTSLVSNGGGDLNGGGEIFVAKLDADGNYLWAVSGG